MERDATGPTEPSMMAIAHLHQGNKIAAIKQVREEMHMDLVDAKNLIDRYLEAHPELGGHQDASSSASTGKLILGAIIATLVIVAAYLALKTM
jgi:ribosomal protein L7/L12